MSIRLRFPSSPAPEWWRDVAAARVEHGKRLDQHLPSILIDSVISRSGATLATAFGFAWGTLLSRGTITRHGKLFVFRGMPSWAFGRGGTCVGSCFLTGASTVSPAILEHESKHRAQWQRYGLLLPLLYFLAGRNPLFNRFEIEAGLEQGGYVQRSSSANKV